jgi:3-hydroxyacyl-[acyl-carrier-protein] dehydratase
MADAPPTDPAHASAAHSSPLAIPAEHPAYAGHFPGNPVLPGVVLLDAVVQALCGGACEIVSAKFHEVVRPGDPLTLEHEALANGTMRFTIRTVQHPVASGILKPLPGPSPSQATGEASRHG